MPEIELCCQCCNRWLWASLSLVVVVDDCLSAQLIASGVTMAVMRIWPKVVQRLVQNFNRLHREPCFIHEFYKIHFHCWGFRTTICCVWAVDHIFNSEMKCKTISELYMQYSILLNINTHGKSTFYPFFPTLAIG